MATRSTSGLGDPLPGPAGSSASPRRWARGLPVPILVAIGLAWAAAVAAQLSGAGALAHHDELLEGGPPPLAAGLIFLLAWQLMIAAMMLPTSLPLIRLYSSASSGAPRATGAMAAFLGGYALVWSAFGALAFGFDAGLHAAVDASPLLQDYDWALAGAVLALAGAFQFTSLKDACLDKCRHPAQFLIRYYERGVGGGLKLGTRHGLYCVGCCWALMLVMFAVGVTSLLVMAVLTALMVYEKTHPTGARAVPVTGLLLLGLAAWVLAYSAWASSAAA